MATSVPSPTIQGQGSRGASYTVQQSTPGTTAGMYAASPTYTGTPQPSASALGATGGRSRSATRTTFLPGASAVAGSTVIGTSIPAGSPVRVASRSVSPAPRAGLHSQSYGSSVTGAFIPSGGTATLSSRTASPPPQRVTSVTRTIIPSGSSAHVVTPAKATPQKKSGSSDRPHGHWVYVPAEGEEMDPVEAAFAVQGTP